MSTPLRTLTLALLFACGDQYGGTAVGNPGKLSMAVEGLPADASLLSGSFDVAAIELVGDRRTVRVLNFDEPFDLVEPTPADFPAGTWHTVVVLPRGDTPLTLEGTTPEAPFELSVPVEPMVFEGEIRVDGDPVVVAVELGVATDDVRYGAAEDELDASGDPAPPPEAPDDGSRSVSGNIGVGNGLYVGDDLELAGALVDEPTGCNTAAATGWLALLPALGLLSRRRRPRS